MNLDELKKLIRLVEKSRIDELEIEEDGKRIKISKGGSPQGIEKTTVTEQQAVVVPASANEPDAPHPPAPTPDAKKYHEIKSPMVGTFYRAPAQDSEPFAQEGGRVQKGQTLCIIEAMKLMNEIESDIAGRIVQILPENGSPVEYGEVLFKIEQE